jgi:hypothetical protein
LEFAGFWGGLIVSVLTYYLAGSLVDLGMSAIQGVATMIFAYLVTLVLTVAPAITHGLSFPVVAHAAFSRPLAHRLQVVRHRVMDRRSRHLPLLPSQLKSYSSRCVPPRLLGRADRRHNVWRGDPQAHLLDKYAAPAARWSTPTVNLRGEEREFVSTILIQCTRHHHRLSFISDLTFISDLMFDNSADMAGRQAIPG